MGVVKLKGFDTSKIMRQLKKDIEKDLNKHPEKLLNVHKGDLLEANCPKCGKTTIEILSAGKARCTSCGGTSKVNLTLK